MSGATNASKQSYEFSMEVYDDYFYRLPRKIRDFIEYEAATSISPQNIMENYYREAMNTGFPPSWDRYLEILKDFSRGVHRDDFGGVHPQLDTPRRVW